MTEIQKADPAAKALALKLVAALAIAGLLVLVIANVFQPQFEAWLADETIDLDTRLNLILLVLVLTLLPLMFGVVYFWRLGSAVTRARRFPPPGRSVLKDTKVVEGEDARTRGIMIRVFAALLGAGILAVPVMFWLVARLIVGS